MPRTSYPLMRRSISFVACGNVTRSRVNTPAPRAVGQRRGEADGGRVWRDIYELCEHGAGLYSVHAMTAEEHASHHPGGGTDDAPTLIPGAPTTAPAAPPGAPGIAPSAPMAAPAGPPPAPGAPGMGGGGMGEMMGKMMAPASPVAPAPAAAAPSAAGGVASTTAPASSGGCMGGGCGSAAAKTPIYPSLMTLPALTPEIRAEIEALASQQISEGEGRLATGSESLKRATQAGDNAAMQQSVGLMREGLDELGAGIAARRVLSEGKAPRNLALDWFKREMNLAAPIEPEEPRAFLGVTRDGSDARTTRAERSHHLPGSGPADTGPRTSICP
jgi:hypothetical protein